MKKYCWMGFWMLVGSATALAQTSDPLIDALKRTYDAASVMRTQFEQSLIAEDGTANLARTGLLTLQGDQYRIETDYEIIVTDTETTWLYLMTQNQVVINDYAQDDMSFSIGNFFHNYTQDYDLHPEGAEQINYELHEKLRLTPKDPHAFFDEIIIWVSRQSGLITQLRVHDLNDTEIQIRFFETELNPALPSDVFQFTPPEDVEIIDLRM